MVLAIDIMHGHGPSSKMRPQLQPRSKAVLVVNWEEPERAPHWSVVEVYVGASRCARSVNKKIR